MTTDLLAPCCEKCTHSPEKPCRFLIECALSGPKCHDDEKCHALRANRLKALQNADKVTLFHVGTGTCGLANGAAAIIKKIEEFPVYGSGCFGFKYV